MTELEAGIQKAFANLSTVTHYQLLGVSRDASAEAVRLAYLAFVKGCHADRLVEEGFGPQALQQAQALFERANEAHQVLCDVAARQSYDWVIDRQAKGLPTDANAVVEAEGLFHRGEGMVRRGQAAAAEPLLRKATQLNRGEAEYWAFLGFSIFSAKGVAGKDEANRAFEEALRLSQNLDVTYEFMGRVAHSLGEASAQGHLTKALSLNPKNVAALRELRLLNLRGGASKSGGADHRAPKSFWGRVWARLNGPLR